MEITLKFAHGTTPSQIVDEVLAVFADQPVMIDRTTGEITFTGLDNGEQGVSSYIAPPPAPITIPNHQGSAMLDSSGLPWDERIHSSSKEKTANGTWRARRNINKDLTPEQIAAIEADLRAAIGGSAESQAAFKQHIQETAPHAVADIPPAPPATETPAIPAPPLQPAPAPAPMATVGTPYQDFVMWVTDHIVKGTFTVDKVNEVCVTYGVVDGDNKGTMQMLANMPDRIPSVKAMLSVMYNLPG
jgi:hypothetical protein